MNGGWSWTAPTAKLGVIQRCNCMNVGGLLEFKTPFLAAQRSFFCSSRVPKWKQLGAPLYAFLLPSFNCINVWASALLVSVVKHLPTHVRVQVKLPLFPLWLDTNGRKVKIHYANPSAECLLFWGGEQDRDKKSFEEMRSGMLILQPEETLRDTRCWRLSPVFVLHSLMADVHIPSKSICMIKSKIEPAQVCGHVFQVVYSRSKWEMGWMQAAALSEALLRLIRGNLPAWSNTVQQEWRV